MLLFPMDRRLVSKTWLLGGPPFGTGRRAATLSGGALGREHEQFGELRGKARRASIVEGAFRCDLGWAEVRKRVRTNLH